MVRPAARLGCALYPRPGFAPCSRHHRVSLVELVGADALGSDGKPEDQVHVGPGGVRDIEETPTAGVIPDCIDDGLNDGELAIVQRFERDDQISFSTHVLKPREKR